MIDSAEIEAVSAEKKTTPAKPKATTKKAQITGHPPTSSMVTSAIQSLNEREGSSLQAIKKYVTDTYKIDAEKITPFIKKYLTTSVDNGTLIRTTGKGAAGSFKLPISGSSEQQAKKATQKEAKAASSKKTPKPEKVSKAKVGKPKTAKKSPAKVKKPKASAKSKPKKAKSPKPKKSPSKK